MPILSLSPRGLLAAVPALILSLNPSLRAAEGWETDFEKAKATAAKEKKDLLLDFTGSDWCVWCIRLNKEVFSKDVFKQEAPKHFVLVELDYPQEKEQPEALREQNEKLQEVYEIEGFPTIVLADAKGRPYAKTGYAPGGPQAYNEHLAELRKIREKRDAAFKKAQSAQGLEKAKALHEGLKALNDDDLARTHYQEELKQIMELDKEDVTGVRKAAEAEKKRTALIEKLESLLEAEKPAEFEKAIDDFIALEKLKGEEKQQLLMAKLQVYGPARLDEADKLMDEVIKEDDKTDAAEIARQTKEQIALLKKQIKESKEEEAKAKKE